MNIHEGVESMSILEIRFVPLKQTYLNNTMQLCVFVGNMTISLNHFDNRSSYLISK